MLSLAVVYLLYDKFSGEDTGLASTPESQTVQAVSPLEAYPQILIPEKWGDLFVTNSWTACQAGWVLQRSGHEQLGTDLIAASLDYVETTVYPLVVDKHLVALDICLAAVGETERAIEALERRLEHGHAFDNFPLQPTYSSIKDDPRFQAAWDKVDERVNKLRANERIALIHSLASKSVKFAGK
uniref:3,4-dihydroxy-2-butanone 4-phosphate synthase n=1 Tax=uncultured bacterium pES01019D12 TaxID=355333 RepID=A0EJK5_9BACT|nr:3,4-dihydroxy-2-butanone 4-phosphate synthase [uncultured bacterium pES01019D12]